jgi:hypothetical protein
LEEPVMFLKSAWKPSAVLSLPVVLLKSENHPCAVLSDPVVLKLSAWTFSAALLPLPRSSGFGGGTAWATGASQTATSAIRSGRIVVLHWINGFMDISLLSLDGFTP